MDIVPFILLNYCILKWIFRHMIENACAVTQVLPSKIINS